MVRRADHDRYLCALTAPSSARESLFALAALGIELSWIAGRAREPLLGRIRVQWWRESLAAGRRDHPVLQAVADARTRLDMGVVEELLAAHDGDPPPPARDADRLAAHAHATDGAVAVLWTEALGARDPDSVAAARAVGTARGLVRHLRAAALPGADAAPLAARVRHHLDEARRRHRHVAQAALPALLPAVLAEDDLRRLAAAARNPGHRRVGSPGLGRLARLGLAAMLGRY